MVENDETMQFHAAASVDVRYLPEKVFVDLHFQTEGKYPLVVTIPVHELERLYRNIDQECRTGCKPFAPVKVV